MKNFLRALFPFLNSPKPAEQAVETVETVEKDVITADHSDAYERLDDASEVKYEKYDENFNFPPRFDATEFLKEMLERYYLFNKAWCENNIPSLEIFVTDELYQAGLKERATVTDTLSMTIYELDNEITYADFDGETAKITVLFNGRFHDNIKGVDSIIKEKWYMERTYTIDDALWFVIGLKTNL